MFLENRALFAGDTLPLLLFVGDLDDECRDDVRVSASDLVLLALCACFLGEVEFLEKKFGSTISEGSGTRYDSRSKGIPASHKCSKDPGEPSR